MESSPKLYDMQAFEHIAPYLNIGELIKTATLSKQYNYTLKNYLRKHILPKQSVQGGQNQLSLMKKIFHRQIKIYKITNNSYHSLIPNLILKDIQAGITHALIETFQQQKYLVKLSQLTKYQYDITKFVEIQKKYNGKFVTLVGNYVYVALDHKLLKLAIKENEQGLLHLQGEIQLQAQISQLKQSKTHMFAITSNTFHEQKLFAIHLKEFKPIEVLYEQADSKTKHIEADNLTLGANVAYYIKKYKVYELDVENTKEPKLMKSLKDKQIRRIINGAKHFFAVQKDKKLTSEWDNRDVIEWARQENYEDYVKIFKSEKVTGQTLLTMDKKYMEDVLGILGAKLQQRMMVQLQESNVQTQEGCTVYGWGRNDQSQLGLNPSNPVSNPHKIVLPEGFKFLKCYDNITLIHNKKTGEICMNSVNENKLEWRCVFKNVYNIWALSLSRDFITALCPVQKGHISQHESEVPVHHKKEKLRTAKNIIDKIQWDENIDKKDFRVGYLDKFTGLLEISFDELIQSPEIKQYRIEYFKRNGEIMWSKKDRIDIL